MPRGIETLTCLEVLESYVVRNRGTFSRSGGDSGIIELANLNSLQVLKIFNLEFVRGGIDAERAKLKDKLNLHRLHLNWGFIFVDDDEMTFDEVLEGLEPNPFLRNLEIYNFPGIKLPKWMGSNCLSNLVEISLSCGNRCEKLPAMGMFPCLRVLHIQQMKSVKCLGEGFYYQQEEKEEGRVISSSNGSGSAVNANTVSLFPSLIVLEIWQMENLEEWVARLLIYNSFPSMEKLEIEYCPKLRSIAISFPFLKELILKDTNTKAVTSMFATGGLTSLTSIDISYSPELIYIPLGALLRSITPNLQKLSIQYCSKFQGFLEDDDLNNYNNRKDGDEEAFLYASEINSNSFSCPEINSNSNNRSNSLRSLYLDDCPVLTFTSLRDLTISDCYKLKESITYHLKLSLAFLEVLDVDFSGSEDDSI
ncbi:putative disease resistance protein RGA1 isoform X2 [Papaver somniferum]|uniref:putative disease resistance protein RGA1 isoform X2 n=1 Tax=Papaver somniferum TaxID=3469 RepID=UPI000E6F7613|nr:putative disease resistance protein RGA1 isoform X2 [Papaver somniferum]